MSSLNPRLEFLAASGKMGQLIASKDWSQTPVGDSALWPPSLIFTLSMLLANKFAMYLIWGKDHIQFYNDAYSEILTDKHPRALGIKSQETWPEVWEHISPLFDEVWTGKTVLQENLPLMVNRDGKLTKRFFTFSFSPIRNEDGSVCGILDTVIDTTPEIELNKSLLDREEQFRSYLQDSPSPFLSVDSNWVITYMNPPAFQVLGVTKEQMIGQIFWEVFPGLEGSVFEDNYTRAMYGGEKPSFEGYYPVHDKWYEATAYPLAKGMAVYFQDVTNRKKLELSLSKAIASRDEFLSTASHELKTPLTSLKLQTQWIMRDVASNKIPSLHEKVEKFLKLADKQITRLTRLIEDMVDVSRISSGKLPLHKEKFDFSIFMKDVMDRLKELFIEYPAGAPNLEIIGSGFEGSWDGFRIEQAIANLVTNALIFGNNKPITILLESTPETIKFCVIDQGLGIQEKEQALIFEQFSRGESHNHFKEGMGLGLFITQQILEAHKGTIKVLSLQGLGSTFIVELPK